MSRLNVGEISMTVPENVKGPARSYLLMVNVPDEDWSFGIEAQRKTIGRSPQAEIRIPPRYESVSRRHAEVWRENDGGLCLNDLGSRGGTRVNGVCVQKGQAVGIMIGDTIALNTLELKVVAAVSKLAELMVEAEIPVSLSEKPISEGATTVSAKLKYSDFVRMTLAELTPAELEIVLWMYRGYTSDDELGGLLYRSPNTIRTQIGSIFEKLHVHSRTEVITWLKRASAAPRSRQHRGSSFGRDTKAW